MLLARKTRNIRYLKRKGRTYVRALAVLFIVSLGLLLSFTVLTGNDYFWINNVQVTGTQAYVNDTDLKEMVRNISYGSNLFFYNTRKSEEILKENFQGARNIKIKKKLPDTLSVQVEERIPLVIMYNNGFDFFLVDEEGYVLGIVDESSTNLPRVFYEGDIKVGYFIKPELISVFMEVLGAMDVEKILASSVSVHKRYIKLFLDDSVEVYIGNDKDKLAAVKLLNTLLKQLYAEGKSVKKVDLRYDKVIVSYD